MKTFISLVMCLFLFQLACSQEVKAIKVYNPNFEKEVILKENKRIRVITADGERISGKLDIIDDQSIMIKDRVIQLSAIKKIKPHPLLATLLIDGFMIYTGSITAGFGVLIFVLGGEPIALALLAPAAGLIYGGTKSPNFFKGYKTKDSWNYEVITLTE